MNISTMNVSLKAINSEIFAERNRSITAPRWYVMMPVAVRTELFADLGKIFETMEGFGLKWVCSDYNENGQYMMEFEPIA